MSVSRFGNDTRNPLSNVGRVAYVSHMNESIAHYAARVAYFTELAQDMTDPDRDFYLSEVARFTRLLKEVAPEPWRTRSPEFATTMGA